MASQYTYDFVRLNLKGLFELKTSEDYHEIIKQREADGWLLVDILTPPTGGHGYANHFELIFEKTI